MLSLLLLRSWFVSNELFSSEPLGDVESSLGEMVLVLLDDDEIDSCCSPDSTSTKRLLGRLFNISQISKITDDTKTTKYKSNATTKHTRKFNKTNKSVNQKKKLIELIRRVNCFVWILVKNVVKPATYKMLLKFPNPWFGSEFI